MKSFNISCGLLATVASIFGKTTRLSPFNLIGEVDPEPTDRLAEIGFLDSEGELLEAYSTLFSILATPDLFFSIAMGESGNGAVVSFYCDSTRDSELMISCVPRDDNSFDIGFGIGRNEIQKWADSFAPEEGVEKILYCDTFHFDSAIALIGLVDLVRGTGTSLESFSFKTDEFSDFLEEMICDRTDTYAGALAAMTYPKTPDINGGEMKECLDFLVGKSIIHHDSETEEYSITDEWIRNFYFFYEMIPRYFSIHAQTLQDDEFLSGAVTILGTSGSFFVVEPHPSSPETAIAAMVGPKIVRDTVRGIFEDPMKWLRLPGRVSVRAELEQ